MKSELEQICDLVRACGQFIKDADRSQLHVDAKGGHANFVTEYDKQVQERLRVGLRAIMPDAHFVGEEGTTQAFAPTGKFFIVDPIDGTTNFIKDYHFSSISVALVVDNAAEFGAIHIKAQELFDRASRNVPQSRWSEDGVHPTPAGHQLLADAWIKATSGLFCS